MCYLFHLAVEPEELGGCFDLTIGKASGTEQPVQKPAQAQLRPLSEVAYTVQASDWSGSKQIYYDLAALWLLPLCTWPDQSNACTEYATSLSGVA